MPSADTQQASMINDRTPANHLEYLDFLAWVNRCLFPSDFEDELISLGVDKTVAFGLRLVVTSERNRVKGIVDVYQDCITSEEDKAALGLYLEYMADKHKQITLDRERRHQADRDDSGLSR